MKRGAIDRLRGLGTDHRYRRMFLGFGGGIGLKAATAISHLVTLPLLLTYLGDARYGLLITIVGFLNASPYADLGTGFGLQNVIAKSQADEAYLRRVVSNCFIALVGVMLALVLIGGLVVTLVPNVGSGTWLATGGSAAETRAALLTGLAFFGLGVPIELVYHVQAGSQEMHRNYLFAIAGMIVSTLTSLAGVWLGLSTAGILVCYFGSQVAIQGVNFGVEFFVRRPGLRPRWSDWDPGVLRGLVGLGTSFFLIQLALGFSLALDNVVIGRALGLAAVAQFAIGVRLVNLMATPLSAFAKTALPALNDALAGGDIGWVRGYARAITRMAAAALLVGVPVFYFAANPLLSLWVGPEYRMSEGLRLGFCAYLVYAVIQASLAQVMMSDAFYTKTRVLLPAAVVLGLAGKAYAVESGLPALLVANLLFASVIYFGPASLAITRYLRAASA